MKLYKVVLDDGRSESVPADSYSEVDDRYVFFSKGAPIPDVFFDSFHVVGINVVEDPYVSPEEKWLRFVRQNQMPDSDSDEDELDRFRP